MKRYKIMIIEDDPVIQGELQTLLNGNVVNVNQMIGIMLGSIAVFGIIYYFVTLLPDGEGGR